MSLTINRSKGLRLPKSLQHRIADIPGGVTVSVRELGGEYLLDGTPIGKDSNGIYHVHKTAKVVMEATASATTYEVAKGHHFKVGDYFAVEGVAGKKITDIDKDQEGKDLITLSETLGVLVKANATAYESKADSTDAKVTPVALTGDNIFVQKDTNLFVSAWVIGVALQDGTLAVSEATKTALKGIIYI